MAYVMQRTPGLPRFQRAQHQNINDVGAVAGALGDQIATQNMMKTINAAKQADENITARGMMDMLQKQGIRQGIADKGNAAIAQMFAPTAAEASASADAAELVKMNREFNRDKAMQEIKSSDALRLAGVNNARMKSIADARNAVLKSNNEANNKNKTFKPGKGFDDIMKSNAAVKASWGDDPTDSDAMELRSYLANTRPDLTGKNLDRFLNAYLGEHGVMFPSVDDQDFDPGKADAVYNSMNFPIYAPK